MKKNEVILFKQWDSDTTLKGELLSVIYILILNQIISHLPNTERPRLTFGQFPFMNVMEIMELFSLSSPEQLVQRAKKF